MKGLRKALGFMANSLEEVISNLEKLNEKYNFYASPLYIDLSEESIKRLEEFRKSKVEVDGYEFIEYREPPKQEVIIKEGLIGIVPRSENEKQLYKFMREEFGNNWYK